MPELKHTPVKHDHEAFLAGTEPTQVCELHTSGQ